MKIKQTVIAALLFVTGLCAFGLDTGSISGTIKKKAGKLKPSATLNSYKENASLLVDQGLYSVPQNVIVVVVNSSVSVKDRDKKALNDAAIRYSMLKMGIDVQSASRKTSINTFGSVDKDYETTYDGDFAEQAKEKLIMLNSKEISNNQFVYYFADTMQAESARGEYWGLSSKLFKSSKNAAPLWTKEENIPYSKEYDFAVGVVKRFSSYSKGVMEADMAAACQIVNARALKVVSTMDSTYRATTGTASRTTNKDTVTFAEGHLDEFTVLDRWVDPSNGEIYSFAASRK